MTSTHMGTGLGTDPTSTNEFVAEDVQPEEIATDNNLDAMDHDSFSDTYDAPEQAGQDSSSKPAMESAEDDDDDYAATFDSDAEETSSKQDVSNGNADLSTPAPVPVVETTPSIAFDAPIAIATNGQENPASLSFSHPGSSAEAVPNTALPQDETSQSQSHTYGDVTKGEIDIQQLLDNITATAEMNAANSTTATPTSANISSPNFPPNTGSLPAHASLPPRPQVSHTPPMHLAYAPQDDIRKYHAGPSANLPPPPISSYRPSGVPMSIVAAGAPGTSTDPRNVLPPPPSASFHPPPSIISPAAMSQAINPQLQRLPTQDRPSTSIEPADDDFEIQFSPTVQKLYDEFLADERMYVTEGLWDRFPAGSRLFIGNLPTEKVTKRDIFYVFHKYGRLAQVSIKQAYGFVQFHDIAACYTALEREQGQELRGRKMHLEISKPQKNTRNANAGGTQPPIQYRRSRSPDHLRGSGGGRGAHAPTRGATYDRYESRAVVSPRDSDFRAPLRARDDYRPGRSPSPTRGNYRGRDYYDGRERRRSRSRSPYGRRDSDRYRERSPSPRIRNTDEDSDLQVARRNPRDVPEVQIILMDELDRGFIAWVDDELRGRGLKTEVMFLAPRLPLAAVIRRQILEGVLAVSQLTRRSQDTSKIPLQVFDRTGGANNVRFDEYQDLEPKIAAELVLRAKKTQAAAPAATAINYSQPQFTPSQSYQPPAPAAVAPNLANLVGQLDNATLQKLLGTLNTAPTNAPPANPTLDLAGLLGGLVQQQQPQNQAYQSQPQASTQYGAQPNTANLASFLGNGGQSQAQGQQSAQQVQNIMAQLAKFRQ